MTTLDQILQWMDERQFQLLTIPLHTKDPQPMPLAPLDIPLSAFTLPEKDTPPGHPVHAVCPFFERWVAYRQSCSAMGTPTFWPTKDQTRLTTHEAQDDNGHTRTFLKRDALPELTQAEIHENTESETTSEDEIEDVSDADPPCPDLERTPTHTPTPPATESTNSDQNDPISDDQATSDGNQRRVQVPTLKTHRHQRITQNTTTKTPASDTCSHHSTDRNNNNPSQDADDEASDYIPPAQPDRPHEFHSPDTKTQQNDTSPEQQTPTTEYPDANTQPYTTPPRNPPQTLHNRTRTPRRQQSPGWSSQANITPIIPILYTAQPLNQPDDKTQPHLTTQWYPQNTPIESDCGILTHATPRVNQSGYHTQPQATSNQSQDQIQTTPTNSKRNARYARRGHRDEAKNPGPPINLTNYYDNSTRTTPHQANYIANLEWEQATRFLVWHHQVRRDQTLNFTHVIQTFNHVRHTAFEIYVDNRTTPFTILYAMDRQGVAIHNLRMPYHEHPHTTLKFTEHELHTLFSYDDDHTYAQDKQAWQDYRAGNLAINGPDWIPFTYRPHITLPLHYETRLTYPDHHFNDMTDEQAIKLQLNPPNDIRNINPWYPHYFLLPCLHSQAYRSDDDTPQIPPRLIINQTKETRTHRSHQQ